MNSGELPLKTRRKVSLAPEGAVAESAAHAARAAAAISRKKRSSEVFMVFVAQERSMSCVTVKRSTRRYDARQPATRCAARPNFGWQSRRAHRGPRLKR